MALTNSGAIWTEHQSVAQSPAFGKLVSVPDDFLFAWDVGDDLSKLGLVFTGDTNRTYIDANGVVRNALANVPRDAAYVKNNASGLYERAWLLEGSRTNAYTFSGAVLLANGYGENVGGTLVANAAVAPDGTASASKHVPNTSSGYHGLYKLPPAVTDNSPNTASGFWKAGEYSIVCVRGVRKNGTSFYGYVNLATGAVSNVDAGLTVVTRQCVNGWWRIEWTVASVLTGATTPYMMAAPAAAAGTTSITGDGTSGFYVWGMQGEPNQPFASSYIPTTAAAVTRAAETAYFPWLYAPMAMTVEATFINRGSTQLANARVLEIASAAEGLPRYIVLSNGDGTVTAFHQTGAGSVQVATGSSAFGDLLEASALLYDDGSVQSRVSRNNGAETSGARTGALALQPAWSGQQLWINGDNGRANTGFAAFQRIAIARSATPTLDQMLGNTDLPNTLGVYEFVDSSDPRPAAASLVSDGNGNYDISDTNLTGTGRVVVVGSMGHIL